MVNGHAFVNTTAPDPEGDIRCDGLDAANGNYGGKHPGMRHSIYYYNAFAGGER